jgi:hypothetical protein
MRDVLRVGRRGDPVTDRFWRCIVAAFALMFLARIALDGWIEYKNATDSPKTIDAPTCIVKLVKS